MLRSTVLDNWNSVCAFDPAMRLWATYVPGGVGASPECAAADAARAGVRNMPNRTWTLENIEIGLKVHEALFLDSWDCLQQPPALVGARS